MNQAQRVALEDAAKIRQGYLREMTETRLLTVVGAVIALSCGVLTLMLVISALFPSVVYSEHFDDKPFVDDRFDGVGIVGVRQSQTPPPTAPSWVAVLGLGAMTGFGFWLCRFSFKESASLPYVAPVREQIVAALPSNEILLRGSDQPAAAPQELVRAASFGEATPETDLLRAVDIESSKTEQRAGGEMG